VSLVLILRLEINRELESYIVRLPLGKNRRALRMERGKKLERLAREWLGADLLRVIGGLVPVFFFLFL
jgi:hypothetical protein